MPEIGATLNEARLRRKLDLMRVESDTKIRAKYLRALEEEEWDLLPGPTYVKTFLRTYGEYLGVDAKVLVEEYKQRYERPTAQELTPFSTNLGSRRERRRARGPIISPGVIVAACVVLLVGALGAIGVLWDDSSGSGDGASARSQSEPTPPTGGSGAESGSGGDGERRSERPRRSRRAARPRTVGLRIVPEAPVNVCLRSRTGEALIDGEDLTRRSRRFVSRRFRVAFGNGSVRMQVGGKAYPVPETDVPIGYVLRPGSAPRRLPPGELPTCP
jgi:hypothetical protein